MLDLNLGQAAQAATKAHISETDAARFEEDVLTVSLKTPVIVDFWAPWCGPCKQMMPALEKVVTEAQGQVRLVKVNVDRSPELAEVFRVQSVPTVYAFFQGQPVDGFMGAKGEAELRAFVAKLLKLAVPNAAPDKIDAANIGKIMAEGDKNFRDGKFEDAMVSYSQVLDAAPDNLDALGGIGWCLVATRDMESLTEFVSQLKEEQLGYSRLKGLKFILDQAAASAKIDGAALHARITKDPKDLQALYEFAQLNIGAANLEPAIEALVDLTRRNREWQDQKARKLLVELLEAMGPLHPLTAAGRRKLSSVLFS
jgi:putative thioredoxin